MSVAVRRKRLIAAEPRARETPADKPPKPTLSPPKVPFLLDFLPLQGPDQTRLHEFYQRLKEGRLSTTRCRTDALLLWPPRLACPKCHSAQMEWVDLPGSGHVYAFSAVLAGAPLGMENEVPYVVGLVDLDGAPLRLFGRIDGVTWQVCRIGASVKVQPYETDDGRWFYRFQFVK